MTVKVLEPSSPAQWQEAVNAASLLLAIDAARTYGLIEGGPEVNTDRCLEILERGRELGYEPSTLDELLQGELS